MNSSLSAESVMINNKQNINGHRIVLKYHNGPERKHEYTNETVVIS